MSFTDVEYGSDFRMEIPEGAPSAASLQLESFFSWAFARILNENYASAGEPRRLLVFEMDRKGEQNVGALHIDMYVCSDRPIAKGLCNLHGKNVFFQFFLLIFSKNEFFQFLVHFRLSSIRRGALPTSLQSHERGDFVQ